MQNITASEELKAKIELLSLRKAEEGELLKVQFIKTCEDLKPANIIKNTFRDLTSTSDSKGSIASDLMSLGAGILTRQIITGGSFNPFRQVLGSLIQSAVTNLVSKNGVEIGSFLTSLINKLKPKSTE